MKPFLSVLLGTGLALSWVHVANANVYIVGIDGSFTVTGTTAPVEGNLFGVGGSAPRWDGEGPVGSDYVATSNTVSADRYLITSGSTLTSLNLTVADYRYVEVFYSLSAPFTAAGASDVDDHRFFLSDTSQGNNGENPQDTSLIPTAAGSHSFVLDLLSTNGTDLDGDFSGTATWDQFRWDMWNNVGNLNANAGITLTLDKIVYGTEVTAIPEPSFLALLGLGGFALLARRR